MSRVTNTSLVHSIPGPRASSSQSLDDASLAQDARDVGRDVFDVNGTIVNGSDGYDAVLDVVVEALVGCDGALDREDARTMAVQVMAKF